MPSAATGAVYTIQCTWSMRARAPRRQQRINTFSFCFVIHLIYLFASVRYAQTIDGERIFLSVLFSCVCHCLSPSSSSITTFVLASCSQGLPMLCVYLCILYTLTRWTVRTFILLIETTTQPFFLKWGKMRPNATMRMMAKRTNGKNGISGPVESDGGDGNRLCHIELTDIYESELRPHQ